MSHSHTVSIRLDRPRCYRVVHSWIANNGKRQFGMRRFETEKLAESHIKDLLKAYPEAIRILAR
jgi:hypothetical protein